MQVVADNVGTEDLEGLLNALKLRLLAMPICSWPGESTGSGLGAGHIWQWALRRDARPAQYAAGHVRA